MKRRWGVEERTAMIAGPRTMNSHHSSYSGKQTLVGLCMPGAVCFIFHAAARNLEDQGYRSRSTGQKM